MNSARMHCSQLKSQPLRLKAKKKKRRTRLLRVTVAWVPCPKSKRWMQEKVQTNRLLIVREHRRNCAWFSSWLLNFLAPSTNGIQWVWWYPTIIAFSIGSHLILLLFADSLLRWHKGENDLILDLDGELEAKGLSYTPLIPSKSVSTGFHFYGYRYVILLEIVVWWYAYYDSR